MRVQIKATSIELSPSIEEYARKRVESLEKYFKKDNPEDILVSVEVAKTTRHHKSGDIFKAEIFVRAKGKEYYALSEKEDLYSAIDDVKDEIEREVSSWKDKSRTLFRRGGARIKNIIKSLAGKNRN